MAIPTISQVQAVEPILTNMLNGYQQSDDRFVAGRVFPAVSVDKDSGTYFIATKKYFFFNDLKPRAPGAPFENLSFGFETDTYTTLQYAGAIALPDETQANSQVPMSLDAAAVKRIAQASMIRKEVSWATDFMTTGVWGTTDNNSATDWDDYSSGDPVANIQVGKRTISNNTGNDPNTLVIGYIVLQALENHPDLLDRIKYTQQATMGNARNALAAALDVSSIVVGKATYSNTNESATFSATAIIDDDALLCYVNPSAGIFDVTAGKTFIWGPGGGQGTMYRDRDNSLHADVVQHKEQWDQKVTASDVGYIWLDIV